MPKRKRIKNVKLSIENKDKDKVKEGKVIGRIKTTYTKHRPVIWQKDGVFYRPYGAKGIRSRLFPTSDVPIIINPKKYSRRKRIYKNPANIKNISKAFSVNNLTFLAAIGGGLTTGFIGYPIFDSIMPKIIKDNRKWLYGSFYILLGTVLASMFKNKNLKTAALTLAGVGMYDIIQQNLLSDLPAIPESSLLANVLIPKQVSTSETRTGIDYNINTPVLTEPLSANYDIGTSVVEYNPYSEMLV